VPTCDCGLIRLHPNGKVFGFNSRAVDKKAKSSGRHFDYSEGTYGLYAQDSTVETGNMNIVLDATNSPSHP